MCSGIRITAVGDIMLGDHPLYLGVGVGSTWSPSSGLSLFERLAPMFRNSDIVFGNLETVLSTVSIQRGASSHVLRAHPLWAVVLKQVGFNVLSVANNHSLDHGSRAFSEMTTALTEAGIRAIGLRDQELVAVRVGDESIGFLGFSLRPVRLSPDQVLYDHISDPGRIRDKIRNAKNACDYVIVSLHWGDEYMHVPAQWQIELAHTLINDGATLILGHHPHVSQPIEYRYGKVVAYSLGNFVSDMCQTDARRGILLNLCLRNGAIHDVTAQEIWIDEKYRPTVNEERPVQVSAKLEATLPREQYQHQVRESVNKFRREYRRYLRANWYRFPPDKLLYILAGGIGRFLRRSLGGEGIGQSSV